MKRLRWLGKRAVDLDEEVMWICLRQRRYDSYGRQVPRYSDEQLMAMSDAEREALKVTVMMPDFPQPHAPKKYLIGGGVELCDCRDCVASRQEWRERTGRI